MTNYPQKSKMSENCSKPLQRQFLPCLGHLGPIWPLLLSGKPVQCTPVTRVRCITCLSGPLEGQIEVQWGMSTVVFQASEVLALFGHFTVLSLWTLQVRNNNGQASRPSSHIPKKTEVACQCQILIHLGGKKSTQRVNLLWRLRGGKEKQDS